MAEFIRLKNSISRPGGRSRWIFASGAVLAVLFLGIGLSWFFKPAPPPPKPAAPPSENESRVRTLTLNEVQEGAKKWTLMAKWAEFRRERDEIMMRDVQVDFFEKPGQRLHLRSDTGLVHTKTRVLEFKGRVVFEIDDMTIKTEVATYNPGERVVVAPGEVTIEGPKLLVEGKGVKVFLAEKRLVFTEHRSTTLKVAEWKGKQ